MDDFHLNNAIRWIRRNNMGLYGDALQAMCEEQSIREAEQRLNPDRKDMFK